MKFFELRIKTVRNKLNGQSNISIPKKLLTKVPDFIIIKIPKEYLKHKIKKKW